CRATHNSRLARIEVLELTPRKQRHEPPVDVESAEFPVGVDLSAGLERPTVGRLAAHLVSIDLAGERPRGQA
ncbi:MAG: hypothetical protein V3U22_01820, partial [Vicinamibacteria bacterium]